MGETSNSPNNANGPPTEGGSLATDGGVVGERAVRGVVPIIWALSGIGSSGNVENR